MPDNTPINKPTIPGQNIGTEDVGGGVNMPRGKVVTGPHGTDGGDAVPGNPLDVRHGDSSGNLMPAGDAAARAIFVQAGGPVPAAISWLGVAADGVVKGSPGTLFSFSAASRAGVDLYVQVFQSATVPSPGDVPRLQWKMPAQGEIVIDAGFFTAQGLGFLNGIAWGISSTAGTFTAYATPAQVDYQALFT